MRGVEELVLRGRAGVALGVVEVLDAGVGRARQAEVDLEVEVAELLPRADVHAALRARAGNRIPFPLAVAGPRAPGLDGQHAVFDLPAFAGGRLSVRAHPAREARAVPEKTPPLRPFRGRKPVTAMQIVVILIVSLSLSFLGVGRRRRQAFIFTSILFTSVSTSHYIQRAQEPLNRTSRVYQTDP